MRIYKSINLVIPLTLIVIWASGCRTHPRGDQNLGYDPTMPFLKEERTCRETYDFLMCLFDCSRDSTYSELSNKPCFHIPFSAESSHDRTYSNTEFIYSIYLDPMKISSDFQFAISYLAYLVSDFLGSCPESKQLLNWLGEGSCHQYNPKGVRTIVICENGKFSGPRNLSGISISDYPVDDIPGPFIGSHPACPDFRVEENRIKFEQALKDYIAAYGGMGSDY